MKIIASLLFVILFTSCKTKSNPQIQNNYINNLPKDSLTFYFPKNIFSEKPKLDSFVQNWYSSTLFNFKEPILSQFYIGQNIYRFLWLRSFHRPVVFTLHQSKDQVWLTTKILDKQPVFNDDKLGGVPKNERYKYLKDGYIVDKHDPDLLVIIADRKANIVYDKTISLSGNEWNEFEQLLLKANFWTLPTVIDDGRTDGAQWIIEGHLKNRYHVVAYHSPVNNEYEIVGRFLMKLSEIKNEKIY